jgi:hypothetical protein
MQLTPMVHTATPVAGLGQQGCPTAPHATQVLVRSLQRKPALQGNSGGQQGAPGPPQTQVPLKHWSVPAWQPLPSQQGCRAPPQV